MSKKQKNTRLLDESGLPKKKHKKHKKFWFGMKIALLVALLAILAVLLVFYVKFGDDLIKWKQEAEKLVEESTVDTFKASETSIVYASNKSMIAKLKGDKDSYYLSFEDIPQYVKDAFVSTEDRDFYKHEGVNFLSSFKATALYVRHKITGEDISRGGSTITQQLSKIIYLSGIQTVERKIREMFIASELEKKYSKNQILEFYVNNICFANGYYGIEAAAKGYFSKSASELSLAQLAFLCAIPNNPTRYNPLENYSNTIDRKDRILKQMMEEGSITAADYGDACYEEIILDPADAIKTQNYMTTYAISCATKALMESRGFEFKYEFDSDEEEELYDEAYDELYKECYNSLYTGGYRIYTSLNKKKQKSLQKAVNDNLSGFTSKSNDGTYEMQGAATCIDNETGFVVAIVGGRKQKSITGYTLNRAYQSYRQPGSCFKPLVVYTPQLERGYTADTIVDDSYFEGGPKNSGSSYAGKVPLRYAVEHSKNVVAWKLFEELTPKVGLSYVLKMNFARIVDDDYYLSSALGGLTNGVSTTEMASAYAAIENDGVYRTPTCIKKITDSEGNVIVNNMKKRKTKQVYEEAAARQMTDILEGVLTSGTAAGHALNNMACAGKTGTTSDQKDGWFCGYTPYYTTTVWVGYDNPKTVSDLYGSTYPLRIWEQFMTGIHEGLEYRAFEDYVSQNSSSSSDDDNDNEDTIPEETIEPDAADTYPEDDEPDAVEEEPTEMPEKTKAPVVTEAPAQDVPADNPDDYEDVGDESEPVEDVGDDEETYSEE